LACLAPRLEVVILPKDTILYEPGDPIRYTYFPHDALVGLINILEESQFFEVASFRREGLFGNVHAGGGNLLTRRVSG
jgi:hypothetical protein